MDLANPWLDQYECDTAVIRCIDPRFQYSDVELLELFFYSIGHKPPFFASYNWPGGHKDIIDNEAFCQRFLELFRQVSVNHHRVCRLILMMHWDCAGFGGLRDEAVFQAELIRAREFLRSRLPEDIEFVLVYSKRVADHPRTHSPMLRYMIFR